MYKAIETTACVSTFRQKKKHKKFYVLKAKILIFTLALLKVFNLPVIFQTIGMG